MTHSFNIEVAKKYGVEEATVLHNIAFWIKHNKANNKNFFDSHYWTFNSAKALEELFPYFNAKKISRLLLKLEDKRAIKSGNYNKVSYDRTKWYTIIDLELISIYELDSQPLKSSISQKCPMEKTEVVNRVVESVQPIPDINKHINTFSQDTKTESNLKSSGAYAQTIRMLLTGYNINYEKIVNTGKSLERIKEVIKFAKENNKGEGWIVSAIKDDYTIENKPQFITKKRKVLDLSELGYHFEEYQVPCN